MTPEHGHPDQAGTAGAAPADRSPPRRRRLVAIALAAAVAAVLSVVSYNFYWQYSADRFEAGIRQWLAARGQEGTRITYAAIRVDGYPFHLRAVIAQPSAARFAAARPWSWRGPAITLTARPWRPSRFTLTAPGRHWLTTVIGGHAHEYDVAVETLRLKLRLRGAAVARARLAARGVMATEEGAGEVFRLKAADVAVERSGRVRAGKPGLVLTVDGDDAAFAAEPAPGLGRAAERVGLTATVGDTVPAAMTRDELAKWRDLGGIVDVRRLTVRYGPLAADGDGTLALDSKMQPIAAFAVRVRGYDEVIDRLMRAGAVKPEPAALAKAALHLLAAGQGGPGGEIKVPISIQNRKVYLGPVAVGRLPPVAWD